MKLAHKLLAALPLLGALFASPSCQPAFTTSIPPGSLRVTITQNGGLGSATDRLPISFNAPQSFVVEVDALDNAGNIDTGFTGYVRFSVVPGSVVAASGDNTNGRN